ncbi:flagellar biosynthetic protein FliO [Pseudoduganella chitinolytica]|uniref:Flagellar biosynthetic protein FliO n=1 Tax=Pseudoduganella chitinolytica TaxID=34070 RepID=A0ABY8BBR2_9BURK|nr:flagellar biosynthetic protein FliO [Pseudoduganella chitinolytica]WEF32858.1 flagellar biosynthetic protein FliO [Pseudoduganella chitinolytica]
MNPQQSPAAAPTQATQAAIPFKRDDGVAGSTLASGGLGVLVLSLLAIAVVLFLRRRLNLHTGQATGTRSLRVLESARLGPRALLSVVEFDGTRYLLAQGEHGVTCVASTPAAPATPVKTAPSGPEAA